MEVLAAFLSSYGDIEDAAKAKSLSGTAHGDYLFTMCIYRGGFMAIPHTMEYESQTMTVVVEGRKPQCWNCKQLGHFSKSCPQKTTTTATNATAVIAKAAAANTVTKPTTGESPKQDTGGHPDKEEGWIQVQRGGKKKKGPVKTTENQTPITATNAPTVTTVTNTTTRKVASSSSSSTTAKKIKRKN